MLPAQEDLNEFNTKWVNFPISWQRVFDWEVWKGCRVSCGIKVRRVHLQSVRLLVVFVVVKAFLLPHLF